MPACASASPILRSAGIFQIMQQEVQICKPNLSSNLVELPCPLQVADRPEALGGFELGLQHIGSRSRAHIILEGHHHQSGDPQAVLPAAIISAGVLRPRSVRSKSVSKLTRINPFFSAATYWYASSKSRRNFRLIEISCFRSEDVRHILLTPESSRMSDKKASNTSSLFKRVVMISIE